MNRIVSIVIALGLALGVAGFVSGCKSDEEKFCAKLKEIDADRFDDCETDALPEVKKMCGEDNFATAVACIEAVDTMDKAEACIKTACPREKK